MRRVPEYDALRGLAVLGVLLFHLQPNEGWTHFGMTGVHLFFVLSGFLISTIVADGVGTPHFFRNFFVRRALRIWPIYYLALLGLVAFQSRLPNPPPLWGLPYYLTFTQYAWAWPGLAGWVTTPPETVRAFEHSWTLAAEEQFYLVWPLAIALVGRKRLAALALGVIGFGVWYKTLGYHTWTLPHVAGAFAMGGLLAAILGDKGRVNRHRGPLSVFFLMASAAGVGYLWWFYKVPISGWSATAMKYRDSLQNYAFYSIHFGLIGFVATNAGRWFLAPLRLKELTYFGEVSYGLYLYHLPVYWLVGGYYVPIGEPWTMGLAKIALTFLVANLSYRYVERPILALKDWFPYAKRPEAAVEAPRPVARQPRMIHGGPHSAEGGKSMRVDG